MSPLKRSTIVANMSSKARNLLDESSDDDEDEETLQLKLQAIQARLKLKRLAKSKAKAGDHGNPRSSRATPPPSTRPERRGLLLSRKEESLQVPVSPTRRQRTEAIEPRSPGRILLGIDKGLKAKDVSLCSRPSPRKYRKLDDDPFTGTSRQQTSRASNYTSESNSSFSAGISHTKSFSARLAEARTSDRERSQRLENLKRKRSTGFNVDSTELDEYRAVAKEVGTSKRDHEPQKQHGFSRDQIMQSLNLTGGGVQKSHSISDVNQRYRERPSSRHSALRESQPLRPTSPTSSTRPRSTTLNSDTNCTDQEPSTPDPSLFEPFSKTHLSKRILPHTFLERRFASKTTFLIPDLIGSVQPPNYDPPDTSTPDMIVLGIIASKSTPLDHKAQPENKINNSKQPQGKFMAIRLTDFEYELDLYLFGSAFTRYWKLTPGTLVAILNPNIMPPPPNKPGRTFGLSLNSDTDDILEIGTSQNLGFCSAIRKDGKKCEAWIDRRHTEYCEFHVDVQVRKTKSSRIELANGTALFGPGGKRGSRTGTNGTLHASNARHREDNGLSRNNIATYDRSTGTSFYVAPAPKSAFSSSLNNQSNFHPHMSSTRTTASILDAEIDEGAYLWKRMGRASREERTRQRLAEREREKEIAKKLGSREGIGGIGGEYMRKTANGDANGDNDKRKDANTTERDIKARMQDVLGSGRRGAERVRLSPGRRKGGLSVSGFTSGTGDGGGGVGKKTRFVTSRGIKEAGRDSLGANELVIGRGRSDSDDDDDGLEIV
ncbi:MAG: hypothetical protein M1834_006823 [Cirrosporium novae-zelandiae]|nr:MAG: hypothetical protein M1834_006823 [Cirrosporium novae-zelandiae]